MTMILDDEEREIARRNQTLDRGSSVTRPHPLALHLSHSDVRSQALLGRRWLRR